MARILVIEDNRDNRELMQYLLAAFGHVAISARDGETGIDTARRERPDLVLCDIHLPGADGYEVVRKLRTDRTFDSMPVIAVTALAML
jgi:CheY-like chemotaxis protein